MSKVDSVRAKLRAWTGKSSLSDHSSYRGFCALAAADDTIFSGFRSVSGPYTAILEHVSDSLALEYAAELNLANTGSETELNLALSDSVGSPRVLEIAGVGATTGSVLRYLSVARIISKSLQPSSRAHFLEIGVGYGGQVRVLSGLYPNARFTLVDLPETLTLARRFLQESGVGARIEYVASTKVRSIQSDILISNYALSELRRPIQERYMRDFVSCANAGLVTWNSISPRLFRSVSSDDFAARVNGSLFPEVPLSYPGNQVVLWRK